MAKRALLVGCNYPGTESALNGCVNDVKGMISLLSEHYGFSEDDMTILIDTEDDYPDPTGKNIKDSLKELVSQSEEGDLLVFHFSGHGTQIPSDAEEIDAMDEAIVPCDMNVITDDDLRVILTKLPDGVKFTMIADCCHSGTMLDHTEVAISGEKQAEKEGAMAENLGGILGAFGLKDATLEEQGITVGDSEEFKNRGLPSGQLLNILTTLAGSAVGKGNIASTLTSLFGKDSSVKMGTYVALGAQAYQMITGNSVPPVAVAGITKVLNMFVGGNDDDDDETKAANAQAGGMMTVGGDGEPQFAISHTPGQKPPIQLGEDVGILITGCQAHETSADACPSGEPEQAYGALSNALRTVVSQHVEGGAGVEELSNMELVAGVRGMLKTGGFAQNPCLECSEANAEKVFILQD